MANLSITSVCNRTCTYCFARDAISKHAQQVKYMSRTTFQKALDFLECSGIDQARLLGGEPTLHPDFSFLADQVMERGLRLLVFSNGLMPEDKLPCLERIPDKRVKVLINVATPRESRPQEQERQLSVFHRLGPRVLLGINICKPAVDLDFMLGLIQRFHLSKTIRLGLAHPCVMGDNYFLKARYYSEVGQRIIDFSSRANAADVSLEFDCGFVPCMFPDGWGEVLRKSDADIGLRCNPILDVLPGGHVVSCYPLAALYDEPLPDDQNADWLRGRFKNKLKPYRSLGIFRECSICSLRENNECLGGCLASAIRRLHYTQSKIDLPKKNLVRRRPQEHISYSKSKQAGSVQGTKSEYADATVNKRWVIPYIDKPISFWEQIAEDFAGHIKEVYFPLPANIIGSGGPIQPSEHLFEFLRHRPFGCSVLLNPVTLPRPVETITPAIIEALKRLIREYGPMSVTVSNLTLAARIRESFPELTLIASCLMEISQPNQVVMLNGLFDALVPASRIMRNLPALKTVKKVFSGYIRLIVNEACLPGCPFRIQHFHEMGGNFPYPLSLCTELLTKYPWMRLTGAWVLPQHLHLYDGIYDQLKIAGRVTLRNSVDYLRVLKAYIYRKPITPNAIGGGPASVLEPLYISEEFFTHTLSCMHQCHDCKVCSEYYRSAMKNTNASEGAIK